MDQPLSQPDHQPIVLIVDDEVSIAELLHDVLIDEGYEVLIASEGQSALDLACESAPDLVITDLMMPRMDGRTLCRELHRHSATEGIPVVVMSAAYHERDDDLFVASIAKPFNIAYVLDIIKMLLAPDA